MMERSRRATLDQLRVTRAAASNNKRVERPFEQTEEPESKKSSHNIFMQRLYDKLKNMLNNDNMIEALQSRNLTHKTIKAIILCNATIINGWLALDKQKYHNRRINKKYNQGYLAIDVALTKNKPNKTNFHKVIHIDYPNKILFELINDDDDDNNELLTPPLSPPPPLASCEPILSTSQCKPRMSATLTSSLSSTSSSPFSSQSFFNLIDDQDEEEEDREDREEEEEEEEDDEEEISDFSIDEIHTKLSFLLGNTSIYNAIVNRNLQLKTLNAIIKCKPTIIDNCLALDKSEYTRTKQLSNNAIYHSLNYIKPNRGYFKLYNQSVYPDKVLFELIDSGQGSRAETLELLKMLLNNDKIYEAIRDRNLKEQSLETIIRCNPIVIDNYLAFSEKEYYDSTINPKLSCGNTFINNYLAKKKANKPNFKRKKKYLLSHKHLVLYKLIEDTDPDFANTITLNRKNNLERLKNILNNDRIYKAIESRNLRNASIITIINCGPFIIDNYLAFNLEKYYNKEINKRNFNGRTIISKYLTKKNPNKVNFRKVFNPKMPDVILYELIDDAPVPTYELIDDEHAPLSEQVTPTIIELDIPIAASVPATATAPPVLIPALVHVPVHVFAQELINKFQVVSKQATPTPVPVPAYELIDDEDAPVPTPTNQLIDDEHTPISEQVLLPTPELNFTVPNLSWNTAPQYLQELMEHMKKLKDAFIKNKDLMSIYVTFPAKSYLDGMLRYISLQIYHNNNKINKFIIDTKKNIPLCNNSFGIGFCGPNRIPSIRMSFDEIHEFITILDIQHSKLLLIQSDLPAGCIPDCIVSIDNTLISSRIISISGYYNNINKKLIE